MKNDGWHIVGSSGLNNQNKEQEKEGKESNYLRVDNYDPNKHQKSILVLGNEAFGLSKRILDLCNTVLYIEGNNPNEKTTVDSLNVSVATGILIQHLMMPSNKQQT